MRLRFLLDENVSPRLKPAVLRFDVAINMLRVGDEGAPPLGTSDPDILRYLELTQRVLITNNRISMPGHLEDHHLHGGRHSGVFCVRPGVSLRELAEAIILAWEASEAEEWVNRLDWIPW